MMTSDARKRLAEQNGEHHLHPDAGVRDLIERERRKAAAEALRDAADEAGHFGFHGRAAWLHGRADRIESA